MPTSGISRRVSAISRFRSSIPTGVAHAGAPCTGPVVQAGAPERLRRLGRDLGGLLAVVAPVRHEVLQDHLLEVIEARERLERRHPVLLGLADADQDPARERDPQLLRGADRGQALIRVLGRRALVGDEVGVDRLEHQPLRGGHLAQPGELVAAQHAEVRVRQQAALQRPLARPHHVGGEVLEPERAQPLAHARVVVRRLAGQHQQLLDAPAGGAVEQPLDLLRLVQVRPGGSRTRSTCSGTGTCATATASGCART